jgi:hypothetical protein
MRGVDLTMYLRAVGLLVRNPSIIVVPLLMGVIGVFVSLVIDGSGGILGDLTAQLASLAVLLLNLFGFGAATIMADQAWRRGRASFDDGWAEARRKSGDILIASIGFSFVLFIATIAGGFLGSFGLVLVAIAAVFLIYTIPSAAIGGVPGGAAIQVSIERARAYPVPTVIVAIVSLAAYALLGPLVAPFFVRVAVLAGSGLFGVVYSLLNALVQAVIDAYIALIVSKTYVDISFGRY